MNYKLELKQIVEFPRCRIYRDFIQTLITTKSIRTTGGSFLFYYLVLCSYANYRTSYRRMEHITYTIGPGEWICTVTDLQEWFRCRFQHQALSILRFFLKSRITLPTLFSQKPPGQIQKYQTGPKTIPYWNTTIPVKKIQGFFFFPDCQSSRTNWHWKMARKWMLFWICGFMQFTTIPLSWDLIPVPLSITGIIPEIPLPALMNWVKGGVCQRHRYHDS